MDDIEKLRAEVDSKRRMLEATKAVAENDKKFSSYYDKRSGAREQNERRIRWCEQQLGEAEARLAEAETAT